MNPRAFIISVHPRWANAFFLPNNPKIIELRKENFGASIQRGDTIAIYATLPRGEIIGTLTVAERVSYQLSTLWGYTQQGKLAHITEAEWSKYYGAEAAGVGIWLKSPQLFQNPIPLEQLRQEWPGWQPPQQLQRLSDERMHRMLRLKSNT
jgi:predicted transcriptional regulator